MTTTPIDTIVQANCLDILPQIAPGSVDLILTDLPYALPGRSCTANAWDRALPLDVLFSHYRRILKPRGALILTAHGLFSAALMMEGGRLYRYSLVWQKNHATGQLNANKMPLRAHEDVLVFYKALPVYHPQRTPSRYPLRGTVVPGKPSKNWGPCLNREDAPWTDDGYRMPTSIIPIDCEPSAKSLHPTGKPVALGRWLIRTYTDPGALVLDHCAGSGSFLVAAKETGRRFIGIELDEDYAKTATDRIARANTPKTNE